MNSIIKHFLQDETGATAVEYGLIAALISVSTVTALVEVGDSLGVMFDSVSSEIDTAITP